MVARRLATEYVAQVFGFAVALADRILLTGLMVRVWGASDFGAWSVAMAGGSLVLLFDFGLGSYFANRLLIAVQRGDKAKARHMLFAGNLLLALALLAGVVLIILGWQILHRPIGGIDSGTTLLWIVAAIATATAAKQATLIQVALYRAHEEFARNTFFFGWTDLARISAMFIALMAGAGPLEAAMVYLVAMVVLSVVPSLIDLVLRYPDYPVRIARLAPDEAREAFVTSGQYWVQSGVSTLITYVPTLLLGVSGAAGMAIAQFALMRTLANFSRQVLTLFANVFGLEVSRRLAVGDRDGSAQVYREATLFIAVQTASATGALAALGSGLFLMWTGDAALFDNWLLWLALLPPVLVPSMAMALQVMATANWPKPLVAGRFAQLVLTIGLFWLLPIDSMALRMMAALAIGEVIGLGIIVTVAVARKIEGAGMMLQLDATVRSVLALGLSYGASLAGVRVGGYSGLALGLVLAAVAMAVSTVVFGVSAARRSQMIDAIRNRFAARRQPR
jgi:hypothetical protein